MRAHDLESAVLIGRDVDRSAIVTGDRNVVIQAFVEGIRRLLTDYATRIGNLLTEYLGTPERPIPFGGREAALATLDGWLADPAAPPYLLLAAPAGRGKSALLVRWLEWLQSRDESTAIVFVPISIRFRTNLASVVFAALAARLAHLHGEEVPADANTPAEVWRGMVSQYLSRPLADGRRLLVVLDGADESADWEPGPDLFPLAPPLGLRVVLAARYRVGDADERPWLRRLGWERPGMARSLGLAPLTQVGVADVLQRMGFPLDRLGARVDVVAELHRLSQGDPLLVRLYVVDLWTRGEDAARLQPEDLRQMRPGLEDYLDRWWEEQRRLWGEKVPLREPAVQATLNLLACAWGPLLRRDLLMLAGDVGLTTWTLEEALAPLARFVIGDGVRQGYVFQHPKLGDYFYGRLSPQERRAWERRFLDWGKETLANLHAGQLASGGVPVYLVQYYGAHLERAKVGPEPLLALVSEPGWWQAWEALEGGYGGFLNDVRRAWRAAERADEAAVAEGKIAPYLGGEVRCALVEASVHSLAGNIPPALLAALVEKGVWTPVQGLAYARQMPDPGKRVEVLAGLALHMPDAEREAALREALAAAREIRDADGQAWALAGLAAYLPRGLLREALAAARELPETRVPRSPRLLALAGLASRLAELGHPWRALAVMWETRYADNRVQMLVGLVPHLPEELLRQALAAAREIRDADDRAEALAGLAARLPQEEREVVLREALAAVRTLPEIDLFGTRAKALAGLTLHLPEGEREAILREALAAVREIGWKGERAQALVGLAPYLPEGLLREALAAAREIQDADDRAEALVGLAPYLPEGEREAALGEALAAAREIQDADGRAEALTGLASHLPEEEREAALGEALAAAREIEQRWTRAEALARLASHLPRGKWKAALREALEAVWEIQDGDNRAQALVGLAPHLPEAEREAALREALAAAREIRDADDRAEALAGLASHLPEEERKAVLGEALAAAREIEGDLCPAVHVIGDPHDRSHALARLGLHLAEFGYPRKALAVAREIGWEPARAQVLTGLAAYLPEGLLREALAAAREIEPQQIRAEALAGLARRLSGGEQEAVLREALAAAREIGWEPERVEALVGLAPYLPEGLLREAVAAAREIQDADCQVLALARLAPRLPEGEREATLGEALAAAREMRNVDDRTEILAGLAPHLPERKREAVLREALAVAREIRDDNRQARMLAGLALRLAELGCPREALTMTQEIQDAGYRVLALARLASNLPEVQRKVVLREALATAREIEDTDGRAKVLAELVPHLAIWAEKDAAAVYTAWRETLPVLARRTRRALLSDLRSLLPVLAALGGAQAIAETFHTIQDVGRWWP